MVVTGVGGPAGRAVSAYLRERGARVIGADMRRLEDDPAARLLPAAADSNFVPALLTLIQDEKAELVIPTVSEELPVVAEHREAIRAYCAVLIAPAAVVRIANDKWETARALAGAGVSVPRSFSGTSKAALLAELTLPILSKPRVGRGGRGVTIHRAADELPDVLPSEVIYQEFLDGEEFDVNLFAEPGGRPVVTVVLRKTVLKSGNVGNAAAVERVHAEDVARVAEAAVGALTLEGPVDIDVRRGADGRPAILDINARVGANVRVADEVLDAMMAYWERRG